MKPIIKFNNLIKAYKNRCRRKGTSLPIILNLLEKPLTINQLTKELNRCYNSIRRYIDISEKQSKILRVKIKLHENPNGRIPKRWIRIKYLKKDNEKI